MHWLLTQSVAFVVPPSNSMLTRYADSLDKADVEESWMYPGKVEDALEYVKDWDPVVKAGAFISLC